MLTHVCQMANTHLLGVCVCIVCPGGGVFGTRHLIGSLSLTAQGYMLHSLGSVTSTGSFCQLSGGVCYPTNHMHNLHTLYGPPIEHMRCAVYVYCIFLE